MSQQNKLPFPWFTLLLSLFCIAFFILFQYYKGINENETNLFSEIGAPYAIQIYQGQYWGLFTNSLIHINWEHLLINLVGLWLFGAYLERRIHFFKLFLLGLLASILTSLIQLSLSGDAGVGLSGVNYFLLAFIVGISIKNKMFRLKFRYVYFCIFSAFLPVAYYINALEGIKIGIEAMAAGLLFGFILGLTSAFKSKFMLVLSIILITSGSMITLFHSPWSAEWNYTKGYQFHLKNDLLMAQKFYRKSLGIAPKHRASRENLRIIRIEILSDAALVAHENGEYLKAREYYNQILKIDPYNSWAIENSKKLP